MNDISLERYSLRLSRGLFELPVKKSLISNPKQKPNPNFENSGPNVTFLGHFF